MFPDSLPCQITLSNGKEEKAIRLATSEDVEIIAKISVFYTYSDEKFAHLYDILRENEYPHYDFVLESKDNTVDQVTQLIANTRIENAINFFQFLVDDMLFFRKVNIEDILRLLDQKWDTVYAAHLKLHPGINYSHTTDKLISSLPRL